MTHCPRCGEKDDDCCCCDEEELEEDDAFATEEPDELHEHTSEVMKKLSKEAGIDVIEF